MMTLDEMKAEALDMVRMHHASESFMGHALVFAEPAPEVGGETRVTVLAIDTGGRERPLVVGRAAAEIDAYGAILTSEGWCASVPPGHVRLGEVRDEPNAQEVVFVTVDHPDGIVRANIPIREGAERLDFSSVKWEMHGVDGVIFRRARLVPRTGLRDFENEHYGIRVTRAAAGEG